MSTKPHFETVASSYSVQSNQRLIPGVFCNVCKDPHNIFGENIVMIFVIPAHQIVADFTHARLKLNALQRSAIFLLAGITLPAAGSEKVSAFLLCFKVKLARFKLKFLSHIIYRLVVWIQKQIQ